MKNIEIITLIATLFIIPTESNALITEKKAEEMVEKGVQKTKNDITQELQTKFNEEKNVLLQEKNKLETDLATAQSEQQNSANILKSTQDDMQKLQEESNSKDNIINENNQKIQELQNQLTELNSVRSQLEQKTAELNNLTQSSTEELNRVTAEKDKKIKELEEQYTKLQNQTQQQLNDTNTKNLEEINKIRSEMERKTKEFEDQKNSLQARTQQQINEITERNNLEINKLKSECEQKIKDLENQNNSQLDTIKAHEETIKEQNTKINELINNKPMQISGDSNAGETLSLLDCKLFENRIKNKENSEFVGEIPVQELSELDLKKTESRCLNEITNFQQNVQQALVDVVINQQKLIEQQKEENKNILWTQVKSDELEIDNDISEIENYKSDY